MMREALWEIVGTGLLLALAACGVGCLVMAARVS